MNNSVDIFDNLLARYHENKLAHAFLLESNDIDRCYLDVLAFIKKICHDKDTEGNIDILIDNGNLPSLITIEPDGQNIKKDQTYYKFSPFLTI